LPLQQPLGHELALQTHWPAALQVCPVAHAPQAAPPTPHEDGDSAEKASHVPVEVQHPLGHEVASQTHFPVLTLHTWPDGHPAHVAPLAPQDALDSPESCSHEPVPVQQPGHEPPPQVHAPFEQESPAPQAVHDAPPVPHSDPCCAAYRTQALPLQHPPEHELGVHTHCPPALQVSPAAHPPQLAPDVPHEVADCDENASHVPVAPPLQQPFGHVLESHEHAPLDLSHKPFAHELQAAPAVPHCELDSEEYATHVLPLQQPFGHEDALHAHCPDVTSHCCPDAHPEQVAPLLPHEANDSEADASQVPFDVQQPLGHEAALQTHAPLPLHVWPVAHAPHVPPLAPHDALDSPASASHAPPLQQPGQDAPPHAQAPFEHASPDAHVLHVAPPLPHSEDDCATYATHALPLQQPFEHELAVQTHWPFAPHAWPVAHPPHVAPAVPQEVADSDPYASHVPVAPPLQQPFGHVLASQEHAPVVVSQTPFAQELQDEPPAPHCELDSEEYTTHLLPLQQPFGHDEALHTHCPVVVLHCCPDAQPEQLAPPLPHELSDSEAYVSQVPLDVQQPLGHEAASQTHAPVPPHA
jgi:hypothetical protein